MTLQKKYIEDKDGNQVLPITHQSAVKDDNGTPLDTVIENIEENLGAGGSVDNRIAAAKTEVIGGATSSGNTLKKLEDRLSPVETAVGTGGSVDERIAEEGTKHYLKEETYNKSELNNMITTPNQQYVSVTANSQTTAVTDVLPATGAADTTYRVGNWDGTQYNDSVFSEYAWNGSAYIKLSTKSQVEEVYDISANHADTKYADLTAALGINGANIPESLRKGGMSIKFVQSSDNKYMQYRCMAQSFTTDTTQWTIADEGVYVENPEFVYVKTDNEDKILYGVKTDGNFYFGVGCPQQVKDYIEEIISSLSLDEYEDIVAFLNGLEEGDKTLQTLLNEKVDKEEGKSLIDSKYASTKSTIDNPEFHEVTLDAEGKILEGTQTDGTKVIGGDLNVGGSANLNDDLRVLGNMEVSGVSYKVIENPEYIAAWIDAEDKIIFGLKADGKTYVGDADFLNEVKNNQEAIGKIKLYLANFDNLDIDALSSIITIEDPEGRSEITTDAEGKIISYRDSKGVKHEEAGIDSAVVNTNSLKLSKEGMDDFQQALRDSGFQPGGSGNYTDKDSMYIPEPRLGYLNIIGEVNMASLSKEGMAGAVEGVNYNIPVEVEFTNGQGVYFKKYALLSGQGRSSLGFAKKGLSFDFFNEDPSAENFNEDNTFVMKFGDWVPQDSFHVKSYYTDFFRATTAIVYKLTNEVLKTRGILADRPYKKYYVDGFSDRADGVHEPSKLEYNMETGARCVPDGFPVIVYVNGEFWGLNSWQLKKHRDNYQMSKKSASNIHLDGFFNSGASSFFMMNGTINWSQYCSGSYGIETRNPKNLYCIDGKKYNVDTHDAEIITTEIAEEWIAAGQIIPTGKTIDSTLAGYLRTTGKVRERIEELTTYVPYIISLSDPDERKAAIEERFDVNSFIDYILISNIIEDDDAWNNNGQMTTWGKLGGSSHFHWAINKYDCDISFGANWLGNVAVGASSKKYGTGHYPFALFWENYLPEMKARYKELRDAGVFDADHIIQLFRDWMSRVGMDNYQKEFEKWPNSPCFRSAKVNSEYWERISDTYTTGNPTYDSERSYAIGETCTWGNGENYEFRCIKACSGIVPCELYSGKPAELGFFGSIYRIYTFVKNRIEYMDSVDFFDYNN